MKKTFLCILLLSILEISYGQEYKDAICDCCTYASLQNKTDYDEIFPPTLIKTNKIKELTIYTTSKKKTNQKEATFKVVDNEYKEMIFRFNANGYVTTQILFNLKGQYHSSNTFKRNEDNKIVSMSFHYLDSLGNKNEDFPETKQNYTYSGNNIIKIKESGNNSIELPDNKNQYTTYSYNEKGRIIAEIAYTYYDEQHAPSHYQKTIKYNDLTNESAAVTKTGKRNYSTERIKYSKSLKPLTAKLFNAGNVLISEKNFTYNNNDQLISYQIKNTGLYSECPDGDNYEDVYMYSPLQLIESIKHNYKNTSCELRFVYK